MITDPEARQRAEKPPLPTVKMMKAGSLALWTRSLTKSHQVSPVSTDQWRNGGEMRRDAKRTGLTRAVIRFEKDIDSLVQWVQLLGQDWTRECAKQRCNHGLNRIPTEIFLSFAGFPHSFSSPAKLKTKMSTLSQNLAA